MLKRRSLSVLQLMGIACGVAAAIGMALSAGSALSSFAKAVEFLRGKSTHVIARPAGPMDETAIKDLMVDPAVEAFSPVLDRQVRLESGHTVRLLGIDPFLDRVIRPQLEYTRSNRDRTRRQSQFVDFLQSERSVLVESGLAAQLGVRTGGAVPTPRGNLHVLGLFPNPSGEPLLLMDIAHAQDLFGLSGHIDRVDLILRDEPAFRARWSEGYRIQSHKQRKETFVAMLAAFRLNLEALSLLALFVGVFLIYNTSMFAVVSRRRDVGILRSLGTYRKEIVAAFLVEIMLFGIVGGAFGGALGYLLSRFLTNLLGDTITNLYFFLRPAAPAWSGWIVPAGAFLGCGASLLGGFLPLQELVRLDPVETLSGRTADRTTEKQMQHVALVGLCVIVLGIILLLMSFLHVYVGFAGIFVFLLGITLITGALLIFIGRPLKWFLYKLGGLPGKIAAGNIRQNLGRTSVAVSAFMIALALSIGLGAMIGSFRQSLLWWMNTQLRADLYISTVSDTHVPEEFYREISAIPGVTGVDPFRNVQVTYKDTQISITAIDASVLQRHTHFGWLRGGNENWDGVKRGAVIVSESFSRRFRIKEGHTVTLEGVNGPETLKVEAVFYDYTTEHGLIMMDRTTYLRIFNDRTINSLGIFIDPGNPNRQEIFEEVRRRAGLIGLPVLTQNQLQGNILTLFDSTFAVTRSMRIMAIIVAFFGISGALLTLFIERRRDFGIYRALGFSTFQIAVMTLLEGLAMGVVSFLFSTVTGTAVAIMLIKVINLRSFNWTIFYYPEWQPYFLTGAVALCASIGAALYPMWKVRRTYPQIQIREE